MAQMVEAADRIRNYIKMREAKPFSQLGDCIHGIHTGTEWEAELLFSDLVTAFSGGLLPEKWTEQPRALTQAELAQVLSLDRIPAIKLYRFLTSATVAAAVRNVDGMRS